jgi:hypothetical protein
VAYVQSGPSSTDNGRNQKSIGELFGDLGREVGDLVRAEIALARVELTDRVSRIGRDAGMLIAGGLIAYAGFIVLLGAIALILALWLPLWLSALLVAVVVLAAGGLLVQRGLADLRRAKLAPTRTIETLRQDVEWAKEQAA